MTAKKPHPAGGHVKVKGRGHVCRNCRHYWPCPTVIAATDGVAHVLLVVA